jgi:hypothetical protein
MEKKLVGLLELETAVLECFLEKTPLSPLGVKSLGYRHIGNPPSSMCNTIDILLCFTYGT